MTLSADMQYGIQEALGPVSWENNFTFGTLYMKQADASPLLRPEKWVYTRVAPGEEGIPRSRAAKLQFFNVDS